MTVNIKKETPFLSVNDLKKSTPLDFNIEDKTLISSIIDAQNIDIQNVIGTTLYDYLLELISTQLTDGTYEIDDETDASVDAKKLIQDFILPAQIQFALLRSVMPMRVSMRNKGMMENSSPDAQPVDMSFISYMENKFKNNSEFYSNKLKGYLCWFFAKYPDLRCDAPSNRADFNQPNQSNAYFSGMVFKKENK